MKYPQIAECLSDLELGKAAEYLVVADLILQGYRAYLTDQGLPHDVVIDLDGKLLRIQVKATRCQRPVPQRAAFTPGYFFHVRRAGKGGRRSYDQSEFDLLALVALDTRQIAYMPITDSIRQSIILRPSGYLPAARAERLRNIDQFPIQEAIQTFEEMKDARYDPSKDSAESYNDGIKALRDKHEAKGKKQGRKTAKTAA